MRITRSLAALVLMLACNHLYAGEKEDLTQLRDTTLNLINALVDQGVLSKEKARALIKQAESRASASSKTAAAPSAAPDNVVRVPYVPELVRNQIRDDVKKEVLAQARSERWGDPGAVPDWVNRISWNGDLRVLYEGDSFGGGNYANVLNYLAVNQAGNLTGANTYLNTTIDRRRWLLRARLGMDAVVSDKVSVGVRLTSGTTTNPVLIDSTMGSFENRSALVIDQAFMRYRPTDWVDLQAGKMPNPWLSTDLLWDEDINFDGIASTFHGNGHAGLNSFATIGAFPVQEVFISNSDKWLYAGQVGVDYRGVNAHRARVGLAYYDYVHLAGVQNVPGSNLSDVTAPVYAQKGNTYFNIADPNNPQRFIYGLASQFRLVDITGVFDIATFGRARVTLTGDYVKNLAFSQNAIFQRSGQVVGRRDQGYTGKLTVGVPDVNERNDWQVFGAYRYLEGDSVPDAFTDSTFHLGGTNTKGWILGGNYGLEHDTWLGLRYMAADEIDGPPLAIDVVQISFNTRF